MNALAAFLLAASLAMPGASETQIIAHNGTVYQTKKAGQATQGFLEIENKGAADVLTDVTCPIADSTVLVDGNGQPVTNLAIQAGEDVKLAPGGVHLLLQATHFSVQFGGILPCSLNFTNAGTISIYLYATPRPGA